MCTKCKKNIAVVFITKIENGVTMNEGYCLKCARGLGIPQIDTAVKQMGISEEDLDLLSDEMSSMFGQRDDDGDEADQTEVGVRCIGKILVNLFKQLFKHRRYPFCQRTKAGSRVTMHQDSPQR